MISNFKELFEAINARRKAQLALLLCLMVLSAALEVVSIGAVIPFIAVLTDPASVLSHPFMGPVLARFGIDTTDELSVTLSAVFALMFLFASIVRLLTVRLNITLSFLIGAELGNEIFCRSIMQPYSVHLQTNSSLVVSAVLAKATGLINHAIAPMLTILSSTLVLASITIAIIVINPLVSLFVLCIFLGFYSVVFLATRNLLTTNGVTIARNTDRVVKVLQESFGGIREIIINGEQNLFAKAFTDTFLELRRAQGSNIFIGQAPRYVLEAMGVLLLTFVAYSLASGTEGVLAYIPLFGAIGFATQRALPHVQLIFNAVSTVVGGQEVVGDALSFLRKPVPSHLQNPRNTTPLAFASHLCFKDVGFRYPESHEDALEAINITINRGDRIGIIGESGSGKSTFIDLFMGLITPTSGVLEVDGCCLSGTLVPDWQQTIAHVPQNVFLLDTTIEENIAFGVPKEEIDADLLDSIIKATQLKPMLKRFAKGVGQNVGERGVQISGGERQRIGIARALYRQTKVLVFDEATSALDVKTEKKVMDAINSLSSETTILLVAHRQSTLDQCNRVFSIADKSLKEIN